MQPDIPLRLDRTLQVQEFGFHQVNELYAHPSRRLDWNVFLYVVDGQMEVWENDTEYFVGKGQYLFLNGGQRHWGEPKTPAGTSWYWIHFYGHSDSDACQEVNVSLNSRSSLPVAAEDYRRVIRLPKRGEASQPARLEKKLNEGLSRFRSADPLRIIALSLCGTELFADLYRDAALRSPLTKSDLTVRSMLEYLERKQRYELDSRELTAHLGMNYSYLCDIFKKKTGSTIHHYNSQLFMDKAAEMMRTTPLNVTEISDSLGFKNPYYFSRVFRKIAGCSPSEYRSRIYKNQ